MADIDSLLRRAAAAPLGPLSFAYAMTGLDAWALTVQLAGGSSVVLDASADAKTEGLLLERPFTPAFDTRAAMMRQPWVMDTVARPDGGSVLRLWLHGDGLSVSLLLGAIGYLAGIVDAARPSVVVVTPPPPRPEPVPVEAPRGVSWQSFATAPVTSPAPETPAAESEPEPIAVTQPVVPEEVVSAPAPELTRASETAPAATPTPTVLETQVIVTTTVPVEAVAPEAIPAGPTPVRQSGYCRECGSPYPAEHTFCTICGARLT